LRLGRWVTDDAKKWQKWDQWDSWGATAKADAGQAKRQTVNGKPPTVNC